MAAVAGARRGPAGATQIVLPVVGIIADVGGVGNGRLEFLIEIVVVRVIAVIEHGHCVRGERAASGQCDQSNQQ
ncbi:MAG: hypothetical protein A2Z18_06970 [Armatimonadetes bacterium RBG_16_58_9]|nr:MAG: hypothetical protein A2Z18_06970 [Armatimonadetes bacterium RBG_16_58_9]